MHKATSIELVRELQDRNGAGQYDALIERCRSLVYHDVLKPDHITNPKLQLIEDLSAFPELGDLVQQVRNGAYDESATWQDIEDLDVTLHN